MGTGGATRHPAAMFTARRRLSDLCRPEKVTLGGGSARDPRPSGCRSADSAPSHAPCRSMAAPGRLELSARSLGSCPASLRVAGSAPSRSSAPQTGTLPSLAAWCRGVSPPASRPSSESLHPGVAPQRSSHQISPSRAAAWARSAQAPPPERASSPSSRLLTRGLRLSPPSRSGLMPALGSAAPALASSRARQARTLQGPDSRAGWAATPSCEPAPRGQVPPPCTAEVACGSWTSTMAKGKAAAANNETAVAG
mmetsp:Transcript_64781/g.200535  ORF Transcript_64781/g.200535 Transcript_64781/m.200535 type:complete len:253 (-) Transcript_64781:525-1283(-)